MENIGSKQKDHSTKQRERNKWLGRAFYESVSATNSSALPDVSLTGRFSGNLTRSRRKKEITAATRVTKKIARGKVATVLA